MPQTEAQRRRSEVFARKGPRKYGKDKPFGDRPDRQEQVVDEGSVRRRKFDTDRRPSRESSRGGASTKPRAQRRDDGPMFPTAPALQEPLAGEVRRAVGDRRYDSVSNQLSRTLVAYDAERYREALSVLTPVLEDLWLISDVRVLAGRLEYRAQRWKAAAEHLEFARASDRTDMTNMPVLIDCYRGLKRYEMVDELWSELKEASPHPMIMAEGRVSAAMSYADRHDVATAIRIMTHGTEPRQVQPHHLLEWYVLGDLHDRAGDPVSAKRFFVKVAKEDAKYFDVEARLAGLGE
jgi:tetratricopeptide (TPR) repeat protein